MPQALEAMGRQGPARGVVGSLLDLELKLSLRGYPV